VISIDAFRDQLCDLVEKKFPDVEFKINERRSSILEIRIFFTPEVFMESYLNGLTGKRSFALVKSGKRIWGMTTIDIGITTSLIIPQVMYNATNHLWKRLCMRFKQCLLK